MIKSDVQKISSRKSSCQEKIAMLVRKVRRAKIPEIGNGIIE